MVMINIRINYKKNYRDHRKIVVIDGTTGFVGGFNIGDEYLGKGPLGYWRDTHLKINGHAVGMMQVRFFQDWSFAAKEVLDFETNAFIYSREIAEVLKTAFENDINQCTEITKQLYSERSTSVKIKESISRLFSATL